MKYKSKSLLKSVSLILGICLIFGTFSAAAESSESEAISVADVTDKAYSEARGLLEALTEDFAGGKAGGE